MYKTKNTGTGNEMRGTRGVRGMLDSGECCQTFRVMTSNFTRNFAKHFGECPHTFRRMSPNIPGSTLKHSRECHETFQGMSWNVFLFLLLLKEMRTWGQSKISSCCFCVWCKSRESRDRGSSKFPCVIPVVKEISSDLPWAIISYWEESYLESCQTSPSSSSVKTANGLNMLTISEKTSTTDVRLDYKCAYNWSCWKCRLQMHGICSHRLVYREVVETQSNYKKSYLWWFRYPACGDATGSNWIKKDKFCVSPGLVCGKGEKRWHDLVCIEHL